jgi:hypothetical protein
VRGIDSRVVGRLSESFASDVNRAFTRFEEVMTSVFWVFENAGKADAEDWGVVVHHIEVGERAEISGSGVFGDGRDEADLFSLYH